MEELEKKIVWKNIGRNTIEYAGRAEVIPSSIWMSEKEAKDEIRKRLFDENIFSQILDCFSINDPIKEIKIIHASCWMKYHVFCLEIKANSNQRFALNLLPPAEKRPVFREYWEKGIKAWKATGVMPRPILLSEDGRFFVQEWVDGVPISGISDRDWKEKKEKIITLICESIAKLNKIGLVFFPLLDYEIMYTKNDRVVFLDITRLEQGGYKKAVDLFEICRKSAIKNTSIDTIVFCRGIARVFSYEEFVEFINQWDEVLNEVGNLYELWKREQGN